jgi:hypothetical protein
LETTGDAGSGANVLKCTDDSAGLVDYKVMRFENNSTSPLHATASRHFVLDIVLGCGVLRSELLILPPAKGSAVGTRPRNEQVCDKAEQLGTLA